MKITGQDFGLFVLSFFALLIISAAIYGFKEDRRNKKIKQKKGRWVRKKIINKDYEEYCQKVKNGG